jgi:hypothetical protein
MIVSDQDASCQWEIWVFGPNGFRMPVVECGLHGSRETAERQAGRLWDWLHWGRWDDNLGDFAADREEVAQILLLREVLHERAIDPKAVMVSEVPAGVGDHQARPRSWRADAGQAARGPHAG